MKAIMDLHTHTLAAGHAYSTLLENIDAALAMGLQYLGMSEHGPTSPGGPHNFFFSNYKVIPRIYDQTGTGGVGSEQFIPESPVGQTRRQRKYYRAVKDLHEV